MNEVIKHQQGGIRPLHFLNLPKSLHQKIGLLATTIVVITMDLYGQTNNYFGSSGTLNGSFWSTIPAGPYTSPLITTGGAIIHFNNPATITGATIDITGINATADVIWSNGGTLGTGGTVANINVASGVTLNMISQAISTAAGTGFIKTGQGVLALGTGSNYAGGFTLNNGTIIIGGVNALGNNTLNLNGGIVASNASRNLNGEYPGGINIGGNIQFGDIVGLANGSANLSFSNNISLGATNRQLTLGNAGTITFGGVISGTNGLSFTANSNGTGLFDITNSSNSFTGPLDILGGRVRIFSDGCIGNTINTMLIDGGQLLNGASFNIANTHLISLGTAAGTGINVASGNLTIDAVMADNTTNGSFTKFGTGTLMLTNANTYTGITYINATGGTLHLNRPGGGTLPPTNNIVQAGGTLKIGTDQTLNDFNLIGGNITVDDGVTLTINGTLDYFQPATITLTGTGKILYGPSGTLKYSGTVAKAITGSEFPDIGGPFNLINNNSATITLPFNRSIKGNLLLTSGIFEIGAGALLDLDGASLNSVAGYLGATSTSDLTVQGTTGGTVTIPTNVNINLRNVTISGNRTLAMNGIHDLNLNGLLTISANASFDNGGESQVRDGGGSVNIIGSFITRDKDGFTGTSAAIPGINPTLAAGCTIEYGLATGGPQIVTDRGDYKHLVISGTGSKTPSNAFSPLGTITITGAGIFNCTAHNIGNSNTNLTMNGGRLIVGTGGTQPSMEGVYLLNGGIIEFAGITPKTIRTQTYQNIEVTGLSVSNSSGNITLKNLGTFIVKSGGSFTINDNNITGPTGTQTVTVENGAIFNCGNSKGFNGFIPTLLDNSSLNPDIEIVNLAIGSTINYSRNNDQEITNDNGLIYQNLIIAGNAGIKKAPSSTLTVMGNLVKMGASSFAHNNGSVVFSNTTAIQNFTNTGTTPVNLYDFTASNTFGTGLSILNDLGIINSLNLSVNSRLNLTTGDITLLSTATNTARVATVPATADITYSTGRFNVQRYFPGDRSWRLITSPLSTFGTSGTIFTNWQNNGIYTPGIGTTITGKNPAAGNGLDDSFFDNYSMKKFDNNAYINVDNTLVPISKGLSSNADNIGYFLFVRGDRNPANSVFPNTSNTTLTSRGKLQIGQQVLTGSIRTGAGRYFALVGNPYASPVNFKDLIRVNLLNRFVVWDPKINQVGAFIEYDDFDNDGFYTQSKPSPGGQDLNIQSGQAFFIETDATVAPSSINFEEAHKTSNNNQGMFRPARPASKKMAFRSSLNLMNADGTLNLADGNIAEFNDHHNEAVDFQDALKFVNIHENFSLLRNRTLIGMERRPLIGSGDTLFFNLTHTSKRNYQFLFEPENLDSLLMAFLEDKHTGLKTALTVTSPSVFSFTITTAAGSAAPDRFSISFKQATPLATAIVNVKARQKGSGIVVEWTMENETDIVNYEVEKSSDGVVFNKVNNTAATGANRTSTSFNWLDANPLSGNNFYRVRSIGIDGKFDYSTVVLVKMGTMESNIRIYPNPATDNVIGVEFSNMAAGIYKVRLLNVQGQLISNKIINHPPGTSMEYIRPGYKLPSGIYQLEITTPEKLINIVKVIIQ